ncbi:hypothetical protein [Salinilacihabitans rarus]|uniref:hypothetical protein n=1 Tax=Salinilacihabitans rarus TaxID=2961596 RepID=UPI0020C8900D|nr:hypothetical protein [Salinilacihabitans rarus]
MSDIGKRAFFAATGPGAVAGLGAEEATFRGRVVGHGGDPTANRQATAAVEDGAAVGYTEEFRVDEPLEITARLGDANDDGAREALGDPFAPTAGGVVPSAAGIAYQPVRGA